MENWINEAFAKEKRDVEESSPIIERCADRLDALTPFILDNWVSACDKKAFSKIAVIMADERCQDALAELSKFFFVGGYCAALDDVHNKKMKV